MRLCGRQSGQRQQKPPLLSVENSPLFTKKLSYFIPLRFIGDKSPFSYAFRADCIRNTDTTPNVAVIHQVTLSCILFWVESEMSPGDKYAALLDLFNRGEQLTYEQAAKQLDLSIRQVQRIIERMRVSGIPVQEKRQTVSEKSGLQSSSTGNRSVHHPLVFYLNEEDREVGVRISFTEKQVLALAVAAEAAKATFAPTPLGASLETAFAQLLDQLPAEVFSFEAEEVHTHWHFSSGSSVALDPEIFLEVARSIEKCQRIRIDYFTASKGGYWSYGRLIEPYGLAVRNGSWILVAYCREKKDMREFSLAGIAKLEKVEEFFIRPEDFELAAYFGDRFSAVGGSTTHHVRLLVKHDRAAYFYRKIYHHSQRIEQRFDDESIVVGYTVQGLKEIRSFVQSWGTGVIVLQPAELREIILQEARIITELYTEEK